MQMQMPTSQSGGSITSPISWELMEHCWWSLWMIIAFFCKAGTFKCVEPKNRYKIYLITFSSHFHENVTQQLFCSHIPWMMHLHTYQISPNSDKIVMKMWPYVWAYFVLVTFSSQFHHISTEMSLAKLTACLQFCLFVMKLWRKCDVRKKIKCILKSIFSKF